LEQSSARRTIGCIVAAVGATIAAAGTFLDLAQVTLRLDGRRAVTLVGSYVSTNRGKLVVAIAVAVLVGALVTGFRRVDGVTFAFLAGLAGVAVTAISIYDRIDVDHFVDARPGASVGPATTVCAAGGVLIVVGALATATYWPRAARRARRQTSP
jgi:hypothetical protein